MRLRQSLIGAATTVLVVSFLLAVFVKPVFVELSIGAGIVLLGLLFEARRYLSRLSDPDSSRWQLTDEKFIDPTTGHLMQVRFDPQSGERDYVDLGPAPNSP